ncbi:microcyclamide/patellamide family RiPP [Leptolyngbyaceae cyanobacterium CCMR0082]|uniref:Microcyclamide/patellamide family RiPP n=1 Tax=Adonisia turfae CCMR0082 TaxID=2304604 RepID=A0A6M0S666_9CYAN|nr:DUF5837 family cyanobactin class RiPP [Adonisia turfae]MDV3353586.1 DUF5837 family protein [Leptothoe sp. LEGE 181152]NEZ63850.1 microcyclamide/patellamide family RiPP [Adonisia turfae CCMR0082]
MDKKNLMPNQAHPINRMTAGQLPPELAELSEETLCDHDGDGFMTASSGCSFFCSSGCRGLISITGGNDAQCFCSYDGDDAE